MTASRNAVTTLLALGVLMGLARSATAQPANDNFADAVVITYALPLGSPLAVPGVSNFGGSTEAGEPFGPSGITYFTLWWRVSIPAGAISLTVGRKRVDTEFSGCVVAGVLA
jgi:hypothetical protein